MNLDRFNLRVLGCLVLTKMQRLSLVSVIPMYLTAYVCRLKEFRFMQMKVELHKHVVACIGWSCQPDVSLSLCLSHTHTQKLHSMWWMIPADYSVFIVDIGSSFWGMLLILASTNLLTSRIAAGCFLVSLLIVLCVAKNVSNFFDNFNFLFNALVFAANSAFVLLLEIRK